MSVPRLVIAAPSSGCGKTTVATGLMAAFAARGLAVSPHKVGPDYIDPGYHALAAGRVGRNLDAYLCGPELVAPLFVHGSRGCDLAVVEGVMGLYDGAAGQGELASTAQVAKLLRAPVVLVVDASSQSRSVAALVHGFASWDTGVRIGGVILNKVGSSRHEALLREALEEAGVPVLGALRRAARVETPSRHLGLVPVAERGAAAVSAVAAMGAQVAAGCDLDALMALARGAGALPGGGWSAAEALSLPTHDHPSRSVERRDDDIDASRHHPSRSAERRDDDSDASRHHPSRSVERRGEGLGRSGGEVVRGSGRRERSVGAAAPSEGPARAATGPTASERLAVAADGPAVSERPGVTGAVIGSRASRPVVAVAGGAAFTFSYAEHAELLDAAGAEVVTFDPLRDERLPEGTRGLVIGGGFPEVYAGELGANEVLRKEIAALALSGAPVAAECAGLLYLCRELDGVPMCGVLDADARMGERLTLGYRDAVAVGDSVLAVAGTRMRGHEFHRTGVEPGAGPAPAWGVVAPERRVEGFVQQGVHASYLHTHWASEPGVARRFTERCRTS
ncbi:cobyrinate a,c-diamide synthase [Streptomyces sp. SID2999]|uniref:cobyrinate a,c-diamide synthase n=1 Tax=Streptomyces sp. SID2999 TaxID=2690258 RepID=UPI001367E074|nr:cobyrinate a,c-diamide synthase [Streptomyces sp. SID2999]MYZ10925.1 cobyrinate a,c-diamide synthase [Streptomyces sp. SID2999]